MATAPAARPSAEDRIKAALWFVGHGFSVFSVWSTTPDGACRCPKGRGCDNAGKHPITPKGFHDATQDPERIRTLLSAASEPNYGMVCPEGVMALDVDGEGIGRLAELETKYGPLPDTLRTLTANGQHVFLRWPDDLPRPIGQLWGYVTRWGSGQGAGYVIGPRSVHASGAVYAPGTSFEIATLPDAWARSVIAAPGPAAPTEFGPGYQMPDYGYTGSRYGAVRDYIASRYRRGISIDEIWAGVVTVLAPRFEEPLDEADLRSRFERAWKDTPTRLGQPREPDSGEPAFEFSTPSEDHSVALNTISTDPPAPMLIERLDPLGHTILYGTGGVGKGALACHWIARLVRDGHRILILDYERHPEEWSRRIASLDRGVHSSELVRYLTPSAPIRKAAGEIAWTCDRHELDYVVVDSAVMACGNDPLKPEAAAEYANAILAINRPVLSLAHVTKVDDARYPFGSVFWHNLARMTWSLSGEDAEVLLKHRKHNNYQGLGTFALTITWSDEGQLREVWEKGYNMTILQRALDTIPPEGATLAEILTAINDGEHKPVARESLRRTLTRATPMTVRLNGEKYSHA